MQIEIIVLQMNPAAQFPSQTPLGAADSLINMNVWKKLQHPPAPCYRAVTHSAEGARPGINVN